MKFRILPASALAIAVLTLSLGACGDSQGTYYQAVCSQMHGIVRGWEGPRRAKRTDAVQDAERHKQAYPDHNVTIETHYGGN